VKSLPPHYLAFRIVLVVVLCVLAGAAAIWFIDEFPYLLHEMGGHL
jgi:hypothetical protein